MPKVSVIIPVYNSSDKLPRCLDSLISQTLTDTEFILVNDASTDKSYDILLEYEAKATDRIIVVNCDTNKGAGGARNIGLDIASGQYIGFVDSDDFIKEDMFEALYDKASSGNYDIVDSPIYITASNSIREPIDDSLCDCELSAGLRELLILSDGYIVTKLFKSSIIKDSNIRFRENVKLEDADFLLKTVLAADTFGNIHESKYIYDNATSNETWSVNDANINEFEHIYDLLVEYGKILKSNAIARDCSQAIRAAILHFYRAGVFCCIHTNGSEMSREELSKLIRLRNAKNIIFTKGYDNPYFRQVADQQTIELLKQIDKIKF